MRKCESYVSNIWRFKRIQAHAPIVNRPSSSIVMCRCNHGCKNVLYVFVISTFFTFSRFFYFSNVFIKKRWQKYSENALNLNGFCSVWSVTTDGKTSVSGLIELCQSCESTTTCFDQSYLSGSSRPTFIRPT